MSAEMVTRGNGVEAGMVRRRGNEDDDDQQQDGGKARAERRSRSVMLHGYGGAALRVFGTYVVDDDGTPRKIVVRAYHRDSASEPWKPSDASTHKTVDELEDEIKDWELRATAIGYKRLSRRIGPAGAFTKDEIPQPPKPPKAGAFTKGGIPDPLSVKHGGGLEGRGAKGRGRK